MQSLAQTQKSIWNCSSILKFMWRKFNTKLVDDLRKILKNASLEIWAGFRTCFNVWKASNYSLTVRTIGNRLGPQIWQALFERASPRNAGSWLFLTKSTRHAILSREFQDCIKRATVVSKSGVRLWTNITKSIFPQWNRMLSYCCELSQSFIPIALKAKRL